jgi:hypothetical protein
MALWLVSASVGSIAVDAARTGDSWIERSHRDRGSCVAFIGAIVVTVYVPAVDMAVVLCWSLLFCFVSFGCVSLSFHFVSILPMVQDE